MILSNKQIRVFHTHTEVYPYTDKENEQIENALSIWINPEFRFDPFAFTVLNSTLYIPRGISVPYIEHTFHSQAIVIKEADPAESVRNTYMTSPPKNTLQEQAIDFLCNDGEYKSLSTCSQQALTLQTGEGKTFVTVHSILNYRTKAIVICHQDKIKTQWIDTFLAHTNAKIEQLVNIEGSSMMTSIINGTIKGDFYFINHQTLQSYARENSWLAVREFFKKIAVGIKVFDEAHLEFRNVLMVDFFSNVKKTFYLTANFERSDKNEKRLFMKVFSSVHQFGEGNYSGPEKRKHIIYIPVLYNSSPSMNEIHQCMNAYGFNVLNFTKYALHGDEDNTMIRKFFRVLDNVIGVEGKILITTARIEDTIYLKEKIEEVYPNSGKNISTINSTNTKEANEMAKKSDIICTTIKSCGTGVDIKGLRAVINLEPFSSQVTANQLSGRLREYAPDKDTYFFDFIDLGFNSCERQYKTKLKYLKRKCKEIKIMSI